MGSRRWPIKDPFSGFSHLGGAILSVVGLIALVSVAPPEPARRISLVVYSASMLFLYLASALYHLLPPDPRRTARLQCWDMVAIYGLIAGTYTPVCVNSLAGSGGILLLAVVWAIALTGASCRIWWRSLPNGVHVAGYVVLGWLSVVAMGPLRSVLPGEALLLLALGGFFYTAGVVVFATERPRLWPGKFGAHDLWHACVLAGSASHFLMILHYVAPAR